MKAQSLGIIATIALSVLAPTCYGQRLSPADLQKIQDYTDRMRNDQLEADGRRFLNDLKIGDSVRTDTLDAKVIQVINANQMLVGLKDKRTNSRDYGTTIMFNGPTAGIVDGKTWTNGQWKAAIGFDVLNVTGTTTYKTTSGGSKTVFVIEGVISKKPVEPLKAAKNTANNTTKNATNISRFVGRWKLVDDKGVVSSFLTVTNSSAMRDHAPNSPGTWEVVGNEARIKWDDGFRDVLRLDKEGKMTMLALQRAESGEATDWSAPPRFSLQAVQVSEKQQPQRKVR